MRPGSAQADSGLARGTSVATRGPFLWLEIRTYVRYGWERCSSRSTPPTASSNLSTRGEAPSPPKRRHAFSLLSSAHRRRLPVACSPTSSTAMRACAGSGRESVFPVTAVPTRRSRLPSSSSSIWRRQGSRRVATECVRSGRFGFARSRSTRRSRPWSTQESFSRPTSLHLPASVRASCAAHHAPTSQYVAFSRSRATLPSSRTTLASMSGSSIARSSGSPDVVSRRPLSTRSGSPGGSSTAAASASRSSSSRTSSARPGSRVTARCPTRWRRRRSSSRSWDSRRREAPARSPRSPSWQHRERAASTRSARSSPARPRLQVSIYFAIETTLSCTSARRAICVRGSARTSRETASGRRSRPHSERSSVSSGGRSGPSSRPRSKSFGSSESYGRPPTPERVGPSATSISCDAGTGGQSSPSRGGSAR